MKGFRLTIAVLGGAGGVACKGSEPPARIDRVVVASAMDSILAVGRSSQFSASAFDAGGRPLTVTFTWLSSNTGVANVNGTGLVSAGAAGGVTIRATVPADPGVEGALAIRVVNADLTSVATIGDDAFGDALVAGLTAGARPAAQASWNLCAAHAADGNIVAIRRCVTELRTQAGAATDGTDRALLAVLGVFGNEIERRLAL